MVTLVLLMLLFSEAIVLTCDLVILRDDCGVSIVSPLSFFRVNQEMITGNLIYREKKKKSEGLSGEKIEFVRGFKSDLGF